MYIYVCIYITHNISKRIFYYIHIEKFGKYKHLFYLNCLRLTYLLDIVDNSDKLMYVSNIIPQFNAYSY